jgi:hypothetical protein
MLLRRSLDFVSLCLMVLVASVTGQSPLTCPAPGDEAYGSKPELDRLNTLACGLDSSTYPFTAFFLNLTGEMNKRCITYCASCEADICGYDVFSSVVCSDPSKCTRCDEPLGCSTSTYSSARKTVVATGMVVATVAALALVATMLYYWKSGNGSKSPSLLG